MPTFLDVCVGAALGGDAKKLLALCTKDQDREECANDQANDGKWRLDDEYMAAAMGTASTKESGALPCLVGH